MVVSALEPFAVVPVDPPIAALPKVDLHVHQEWAPRLDRILARQAGRPPFDWRGHARQLLREVPPGMGRLTRLFDLDAALALAGAAEDAPETLITVVADVLEEGAADGAILMEVRFGVTAQALGRPDFMALFRAAPRHGTPAGNLPAGGAGGTQRRGLPRRSL